MAHGDQAWNAQAYPAEARTKVAVGKRLLMVAIRTFRDNRTKAIETIILCAGLDSQFAAGGNDTNSDLAAIRNEDFLKLRGWQTRPPRTPPAAR